VSTTGTASGYVPQPVTTSPNDGSEPRPGPLEDGVFDLTWAGDRLNPVTAEGRLSRALLGTEKPVEPWTPPAAVAVTRAGMHMIPGLNSVLVLGDPNASPLEKVFAVSTDVLTVVGVGVVLKAGRAGVAAAKGAPRAYSAAFETTIPELGIGSRGAHFQAANEALLKATGDPKLASALRSTLGDFEGTIVSSTGRVLESAPPGWTWHHVAGRPGVLQLVPRVQHAPGSAFQHLLHPGNSGGFAEWGSRF
jgi:hypothetical protein